jgi:hypothetical protein
MYGVNRVRRVCELWSNELEGYAHADDLERFSTRAQVSTPESEKIGASNGALLTWSDVFQHRVSFS